jgi:hypothetical protein
MSQVTYPPDSQIVQADPKACCECDPRSGAHSKIEKKCHCVAKIKPRTQFTITLDDGFTSQDRDVVANLFNTIYGFTQHDSDIICATPEIYNDYRRKNKSDCCDYYTSEFKEAEKYISEILNIVITEYTPYDIPFYFPFSNPVTKNKIFAVTATQNGLPYNISLYYAPFVVKMPYRVTNSSDATTFDNSRVIFVEHRYFTSGGGGVLLIPFRPVSIVGFLNYGFMQFYKKKPNCELFDCNYYKYLKYKYTVPQQQNIMTNVFTENSVMFINGSASAVITHYDFLKEKDDGNFCGTFDFAENDTFTMNYDSSNPNKVYSLGTFLFRYNATIAYDERSHLLDKYLECQNKKYLEKYVEETGDTPKPINFFTI